MTAFIQQSLADIRSIYHGLLENAMLPADSRLLLFSHFGDFNQSKIDHLLRIMESSVLEQGDKRQSMKRIYGVLVELLQNISIHSTRDRDGHMYAFITISRSSDRYQIQTGNLIFESDIPALQAKMKALLAMDKNALRKAYIDTLCNENFNSKGGAGLGLLTIAKRAAEPIGYRIEKLEAPFGYFQLSIQLDIE